MGLKYQGLWLLWGLLSLLVLLRLLSSQTISTFNLAWPLVYADEGLTGAATNVISGTSYLPLVAAAQSFYFPFIAVPPPLANPYPPADAVGQSPNVYLQWSKSEQAPPFVSYTIYLEANNPQPTIPIAQGLTKTSFDPATFALDTQYYWRVVATDQQGQQVVGPVWTFRVEPLYHPPQLGAMLKIPAGEFLMGCDRKVDHCRRDRTHIEEPLHSVYLDAYEIDKYEVTNLEYRKCVAAKACQPPRRYNSKRRDSYFNNANFNYYPVMFVSWWDAQNYCRWQGKRLPTEAEWEKAARGAIDTRPWPWGNDPHSCSRANYRVHCKPGDSTQVGSYPTGASPYGLMDMTGNVFEWVQDVYDVGYYRYSPAINPQGPTQAKPYADQPAKKLPEIYFTIRGGSYTDNWWYSRVAHRHWGHHGDKPSGDAFLFRSYRVGFRCARSLTE